MRNLGFWLMLAGLSAGIGAAADGLLIVSAASGAAIVAPDSMVTIRGANLATRAVSGSSTTPPTSLGGTSVTLTDSTGAQIALPLFYVSPTQINAQIPPGVQSGAAAIAINAPAGSQTGNVLVAAIAPGLFSANQDAQGVAQAQMVATAADGSETVSPIFDCAPGACVGVPMDVSATQSTLVLYATGIRNAALAAVSVQIGDQTFPASYAGPAPTSAGLDQVKVSLPASLAGAGTINVNLLVAGTLSNVVTATFAQDTTASLACAGCPAQTNPPYTFPSNGVGKCAVARMTRVTNSMLLPPKSWPYTANKAVWAAGYPNPQSDVDQLMIADVAADGSYQNAQCLSCDNPNAPPQDRFKHFQTMRPQGDWILLDVEIPSGPVITQQSTQQLQVERNNGYWSNLWAASADGSQWYQLTHFTAPAGGNPGAVGMLNPTWSPDGNTVVFPETYKAPDPANLQGYWRLYVADFAVDSTTGIPYLSNFRNISFPGDPFYEMQDISPDGTELLVQSTTGGMNTYGVDIYAVNLVPGPGFGTYTDLTNSPYSWDEHAIYSPSGKKIAWISSLPFPDIIPQYGTLPWAQYRYDLHNEMFLMNADGSGVQQLTHFNDPTSAEYTPQFGDAIYGEWNLDGTQLMIHNGSGEVLVPGGNSTWMVTFAGACGGS